MTARARMLLVVGGVAVLSALATAAGAQQRRSVVSNQVSVGLSYHDVSGRLGSAAAIEVGYRTHFRVLSVLRPEAGAMAGWDGARYAFVGVRASVNVRTIVALAPFFGVGAYGSDGQADLGGPLEFRSGISLSSASSGEHPLSVSFYHLSNAGLRRPNPGIEVVGVSYTLSW